MGTELPETRPAHEDDYGVDLEPGAIVGEYEIEKKLGQGRMGTVYAAVNPTIERRVAIKILRRDLSRDDAAVARFVREARTVNKIRHKSIVEVFGYGATEDGRCYLIMELLAGESLAARMAYDRPSLPQACKILVEITHALEAAHAAGVVHRDLVPHNVFLLDNDRVKLLGFGIARLVDPYAGERDEVDGHTDVYSLGAVAYELIVGQVPFADKHLAVEPPLPSSISPRVPPAADALLLEMLAPDPAQRPSLARVRELLAALRAPRVRPAPRAVPVEPPPPVARRRFPVALAATVVLMIGSYATWRVASGDDPEAAFAPASIVEPAETPFESPIDMPSLRSAETVKYQVVEKPVYVEVERPVPVSRPAAAPVIRQPVIARPAPAIAAPPPPATTRADASKPKPTGEAVLAVPTPIKVEEDPPEPPPDDLDALKRPTFKKSERPVP